MDEDSEIVKVEEGSDYEMVLEGCNGILGCNHVTSRFTPNLCHLSSPMDLSNINDYEQLDV